MDENKPPELQGSYFRLDMESELIRADEDARMAYFVMRPDPRRYIETKQDGKTFWVDKFTGCGFGEDVLADMAAQAPGLPLFATTRNIDDGPAYSAERREALSQEHATGAYTPPSTKPKASEKLSPSQDVRNMTFISVDVCGSTALRAMHGHKYDHALRLMIRELVVSLGQFHGNCLKTTGDGFIGFFGGPSINTQCDTAVDACVSLLRVLHDALNPAAEVAGLPALSIRIGADHGEAVVTTFEVADVGLSENSIASDALNRAVKLQEAASKDSIAIGRALYERIHVQWLERCSDMDALDGISSDPYPAYRLD